jgi:tetratricopeptide (TPR) repeat protein
MRPATRFLPLLFAAVFCNAHAALDASACTQRPVKVSPDALRDASARLSAARHQPGERQMALADALAGLALLSSRLSGTRNIAADDNPSPEALLREALEIWHGRPGDAALARALHVRGLEFFDSQQCWFGQLVLGEALRQSKAALGPNDPASVAISQDLLRIALAQGAGSSVRQLAPVAAAALETRSRPLDAQDEQMVLALVDFFYSQPDDNRQDLQQAERLAQRGLALSGAGMPGRRLLAYRLASIYYAQGRHAEGEAVRSQLVGDRPDTYKPQVGIERQREALAALVRKGDLPGALNKARALVGERELAFDASTKALVQAETALAQSVTVTMARPQVAPAAALVPPPPARPAAGQAPAQQTAQPVIWQSVRHAEPPAGQAGLPLSPAQLASAQARHRRNMDIFWLAQARSYLGEILHAMGDLDGAAGAYEAALAGFGEGRTNNWRERTRTRSDLAIVYRMRGDVTRALSLQQQVLDELLPLVGEDHPDVKEAREEIALLKKPGQG